MHSSVLVKQLLIIKSIFSFALKVADSLRLGGAILKFYPGMLSAQLVGRLLPEIEQSDNIRNLLR